MNHMQYTRVYAPVDLDAIAFNMESMRKNIDQKTVAFCQFTREKRMLCYSI